MNHAVFSYGLVDKDLHSLSITGTIHNCAKEIISKRQGKLLTIPNHRELKIVWSKHFNSHVYAPIYDPSAATEMPSGCEQVESYIGCISVPSFA